MRGQQEGGMAADYMLAIPRLERSGLVAFEDRQSVDRRAGGDELVADRIDRFRRIAIVAAVAGDVDDGAPGPRRQERQDFAFDDLEPARQAGELAVHARGVAGVLGAGSRLLARVGGG